MKRTSRSPILVVDDSDEDTYLFQLLLKRIGASAPCHAMMSAVDALKWLEATVSADATVDRPFVCFFDIKMPQIGGLDILEVIRREPKWDRLPVVMLSTSDDERDVRRAAELGAQMYLQKFPSTATLSEVLAHASVFADGAVADGIFEQPYNLLLHYRSAMAAK